MDRPPPTSTLFPYTTLFRSERALRAAERTGRDVETPAVEPGHRDLEADALFAKPVLDRHPRILEQDRKSTRLNSSHMSISYAVFCLKKKTTNNITILFIQKY